MSHILILGPQATVHDMFNFLTVMIILPLEYFTKVLEVVSEATVNRYAWRLDQFLEYSFWMIFDMIAFEYRPFGSIVNV
jgi:hypothetical protein